METINYLCGIFHVCANRMQVFAGDLFIDMPASLTKLANNEAVTIFIRKTGADTIEQYISCLSDKGHQATDAEALNYYGKRNDFAITIFPDAKVKVYNFGLEPEQLSDLVARLEDYAEVTYYNSK